MTAQPNLANSLQIIFTKPTPPYKGADQAAIEALTGIEVGSTAFAILEDTVGVLTSTGWEWGSSGGGGVQSVTGDGVDNTDPDNPVISYAPASEYIEDAINNGTTDKAPSENAVFDALALKEALANKATDFSTVNNTVYPSVQAVKTYVDNLAAGLKWKTPVKVATTEALNLASDFENGDTVDGVVLVTGDRILIKDQIGSTGDHGIYTVNASGAPTRATDADTGSELVSAAVFVEQGTVNKDKAFVCTNDSITLGVTDIVFISFASVIGALYVPYTSANDLFRCDNPGGPSLWTGTISGAPSGASVTVSAPASGTEAVLVPTSTSQLGKMRLYNITRNNYALIQNYNTGTNVITLTANAPGDWASGDSLTVVSQTVSGGGSDWVEIELTDTTLIGKATVDCLLTIQSATVAGNSMSVHPIETFGAGKVSPKNVLVANLADGYRLMIKLSNSRLAIAWTGTPTFIRLRVFGYCN